MLKMKSIAVSALTLMVLWGCGASAPVKKEVSAAAAKNPVVVSSVVPYAKDAPIPPAVQKECLIGNQLPEFIESYASGYDMAVNPTNGPLGKVKKGRVLDMEIINVHGTGGGAWTGAKSVTVKGTLRENGKVVGTFEGSRYSGGGAFGGYKGTCSILGRCVKALGKDIATWLQAPTMNAQLGDMAMR